jgi:hypothetical protein
MEQLEVLGRTSFGVDRTERCELHFANRRRADHVILTLRGLRAHLETFIAIDGYVAER